MGTFLDTISGFAVLPVIYSRDAIHILFAKQHTATKKAAAKVVVDVLPKDRTIFLLNVPPDATERELVLFFKPYGVVERVVFDQKAAEEEALNAINDSESESEEQDEEVMEIDQGQAVKKTKRSKMKDQRPVVVPIPSTELRTFRQTGRTAFLVFLDAISLTKALSPPHTPRHWPQSSEPRGLAHYKASYAAMRPPLDAVRSHAESSIALFDYEEEKRKRKSRYHKGEVIVDEDGFQLVTRGGAYGQTIGGGVAVVTKCFQETGETTTRKKKKKQIEKEGFYAFQKHEKKRQELIDLKNKWQEDLEKVQKLKETKRYKPY